MANQKCAVKALFHYRNKALLLGSNLMGFATELADETVKTNVAVWARTRSSAKVRDTTTPSSALKALPRRVVLFPTKQPVIQVFAQTRCLVVECAVEGKVQLTIAQGSTPLYEQAMVEERFMQYDPKAGTKVPRPLELDFADDKTIVKPLPLNWRIPAQLKVFRPTEGNRPRNPRRVRAKRCRRLDQTEQDGWNVIPSKLRPIRWQTQTRISTLVSLVKPQPSTNSFDVLKYMDVCGDGPSCPIKMVRKLGYESKEVTGTVIKLKKIFSKQCCLKSDDKGLVCGQCGSHWHLTCAGLSESDLKSLETWNCPRCADSWQGDEERLGQTLLHQATVCAGNPSNIFGGVSAAVDLDDTVPSSPFPPAQASSATAPATGVGSNTPDLALAHASTKAIPVAATSDGTILHQAQYRLKTLGRCQHAALRSLQDTMEGIALFIRDRFSSAASAPSSGRVSPGQTLRNLDSAFEQEAGSASHCPIIHEDLEALLRAASLSEQRIEADKDILKNTLPLDETSVVDFILRLGVRMGGKTETSCPLILLALLLAATEFTAHEWELAKTWKEHFRVLPIADVVAEFSGIDEFKTQVSAFVVCQNGSDIRVVLPKKGFGSARLAKGASIAGVLTAIGQWACSQRQLDFDGTLLKDLVPAKLADQQLAKVQKKGTKRKATQALSADPDAEAKLETSSTTSAKKPATLQVDLKTITGAYTKALEGHASTPVSGVPSAPVQPLPFQVKVVDARSLHLQSSRLVLNCVGCVAGVPDSSQTGGDAISLEVSGLSGTQLPHLKIEGIRESDSAPARTDPCVIQLSQHGLLFAKTMLALSQDVAFSGQCLPSETTALERLDAIDAFCASLYRARVTWFTDASTLQNCWNDAKTLHEEEQSTDPFVSATAKQFKTMRKIIRKAMLPVEMNFHSCHIVESRGAADGQASKISGHMQEEKVYERQKSGIDSATLLGGSVSTLLRNEKLERPTSQSMVPAQTRHSKFMHRLCSNVLGFAGILRRGGDLSTDVTHLLGQCAHIYSLYKCEQLDKKKWENVTLKTLDGTLQDMLTCLREQGVELEGKDGEVYPSVHSAVKNASVAAQANPVTAYDLFEALHPPEDEKAQENMSVMLSDNEINFLLKRRAGQFTLHDVRVQKGKASSVGEATFRNTADELMWIAPLPFEMFQSKRAVSREPLKLVKKEIRLIVVPEEAAQQEIVVRSAARAVQGSADGSVTFESLAQKHHWVKVVAVDYRFPAIGESKRFRLGRPFKRLNLRPGWSETSVIGHDHRPGVRIGIDFLGGELFYRHRLGRFHLSIPLTATSLCKDSIQDKQQWRAAKTLPAPSKPLENMKNVSDVLSQCQASINKLTSNPEKKKNNKKTCTALRKRVLRRCQLAAPRLIHEYHNSEVQPFFLLPCLLCLLVI